LCSPGRAQAAGGTLQQQVTLSLGLFSENRRDNADSPLAYAGLGLGERIDYVRTRGARRWYFSLDGGTATIAPQQFASQSGSNEGFGAYTLGVGTDWHLRGASPRAGELRVGVEFDAALTVARHFYDNQDLSEQTFDFAALTLAPAVHWTRRMGLGELSASLALPLIAWVDHPYADVRFANQFVDFHFVPLTEFHRADGVLGYDFDPGGRYGFMVTYRVSAMELNDLQPVRRFGQTFNVAVVRRFGPLP
jgi:hypothetical protein